MKRLEWRRSMLAGALIGILTPAASRAADLLFQAEAQTLTGTCTGQGVRLEGNHNTVTLSGTCDKLLLKGVANTVRLPIASGGSIRVEGSENHVRYVAEGFGPVIETFGPENDVAAGDAPRAAAVPPVAPPKPRVLPATLPLQALPAMPPAAVNAPLQLSGDDEARLANCAGRDVVVSGSRSAYVIQGDCRSLDVRGDLLTVQAVMRPGARIAVTGRGSVVSWAVAGKGRAPASVVRGAGSRVQRAEAIGGQPVR